MPRSIRFNQESAYSRFLRSICIYIFCFGFLSITSFRGGRIQEGDDWGGREGDVDGRSDDETLLVEDDAFYVGEYRGRIYAQLIVEYFDGLVGGFSNDFCESQGRHTLDGLVGGGGHGGGGLF